MHRVAGMISEVGIATTSPLAAEAGAAMARAGGNAVDAAIAAALVSINTEPGVCSLACGGYVTILPPGQPAVTLDGYVAAPGRGPTPERRDRVELHLEYGGGITTVVGADTVGVPGGVAALGEASSRFGRLDWAVLFEPVIAAVRSGFPLPEASHNYLVFSGDPIFGRSDDGHRALHAANGALKQTGDTVVVPHLADSLDRIARRGAAEFYTGDLGRAMAAYCQARGGRLGEADLAAYEVIARSSLTVRCRDWEIATNPPPAVGGTVLAAMLRMMSAHETRAWTDAALGHLIDVQRAALGYRRDRLDLSRDIDADSRRLLDLALRDDPAAIIEAGSTCHTSAVDASGLACAITMSAGYGSGDMPPGTGIWLNNCLGELELNRRGLDIGPPGQRLPSNMAPTVAKRDDDAFMAIGSPGASRITTAILQTLVNHVQLGMPLQAAVRHPRAHVEFVDDGWQVAYEAGLNVDDLEVPARRFDGLSMYFGGVGAAAWSADAGFTVAADPRRTGGTWQPET